MKKICIIGIDGLEYDLVEKWNLKNLKQVEHGKSIVPLDEMTNDPLSPDVWATFLTGKVKEGGFESTSGLIRALVSIRSKLPFGFGLANWLNRNFLHAPIVYPKLEHPSFLDKKNVEYYNAPYYDFNILKSNQDWQRMTENKMSSKDLIDKSWWEFQIHFLEAQRRFKRTDKPIFFCYFYFLDMIQHLVDSDHDSVKNAYENVDCFVKLMKRIKPNHLFLVLSDHGFENMDHSSHGFYSISKKLNLGTPHIKDLFRLVTR